MTDTNYNREEEISLKDLILKIGEYWKELWRNWILIGLFCLPFLIYFMYKHFTTAPEYNANLTYMLNTNDNNSMTGFASILGSFGLNKPSSGFSMDKLVELSKSRAIIQRTLFNKMSFNGKEEYIGNIIIDEYQYHEDWKKDKEELSDFYFKHDKVDSFSIDENYVLKSLYSRIIGNSQNGI